jgi:uncharacterized damage-inducible protein DinB
VSGPARPGPDEYTPYYARYVSLVPAGDVVAHLRCAGEVTRGVAGALTEEQLDHRYAAGKWSARAVLSHLADTERVMAFRMLWAARGGEGALLGFDQDRWAAVTASHLAARPLLVADLEAVRAATLTLAATLGPDAWTRRAAVGGAAMSARAFLYVIAGHELHHRAVLAERYGVGTADTAS